MLVDTNLLVYGVDVASPHRPIAKAWLEALLNGSARVALPWIVLGGFVRIATNPRALARPLTIDQAWADVEGWLALDNVWSPNPGPGYAAILGRILRESRATGNLLTDAQIAALAIEHGLEVASADTDFARFPDARWVNPLR